MNAGKKVSESKDDKGEETGTLKRRWQHMFLNYGNNDGEKRTRSKRTKMAEMAKDANNKPNQMKNDGSKKTGVENAENNKTSAEDKSTVWKFFVHSQWLSVQSSYFKSLFYSGLKETYSKEVVMKIYEHELLAHFFFIKAMYKLDVLNDKDYKLIVQVLILAHKYDIPLLVKKCKYVLLSTTPNLEMCEYILKETQHLPDTADISEMLEKFLVKLFTPIEKTWTMRKFIALSEPALRLLLGSDSLATESENTLFVALMKWVRVNLFFAGEAVDECDLLDVVKFEFMSVDFLYNIVKDHYLAKRMLGFNEYLIKALAYQGFQQFRKEQLQPKPKKRPLVKSSTPTFSWVVDKEREQILTKRPLFSNAFWHQGYAMRLKLSYLEDLSKCSLYLNVLQLKGDACLRVSYKMKSNLFSPSLIEGSNLIYTAENCGWGRRSIDLNQSQKGKAFTIDVWLEIA